MRVTAATKERTRLRILDEATALFVRQGFQRTTTRQIAEAAGIAAGTLFNYFPTKEALGMEIVASAAAEAHAEDVPAGAADLAEALFGLVVAEMRELEPVRPFLAEVLDAALSPFVDTTVVTNGAATAAAFRAAHLEAVHRRMAEHGFAGAASSLALHLYWTLYLGLLAFWTRDESPHQQQTLALIDRTLDLYVGTLRRGRHEGDDHHAADDR